MNNSKRNYVIVSCNGQTCMILDDLEKAKTQFHHEATFDSTSILIALTEEETEIIKQAQKKEHGPYLNQHPSLIEELNKILKKRRLKVEEQLERKIYGNECKRRN